MSYSVGQVLYVLSAERMRVVPIQIVEEQVRRTLEGELTSYLIVIPSKKESPVSIDKIKGQIFTSLDEIKTIMETNALKAISQIVVDAETLAKEAFVFSNESTDILDSVPVAKPPKKTRTRTRAKKKIEEPEQVIELPNGQVAKINVPSIDEALSPVQN